MREPVEIRYRDFYDFPRMFVVADAANLYLFDGSFDDNLDDYPPEYNVFLMPELTEAELAGSWAHLPTRAVRHLGRVPVSAVVFDATRRQSVDRDVIRRFGLGRAHGRAG